MNRIRSIARRVSLLALAGGLTLFDAGPVWAQGSTVTNPEKSYVMPYLMTIVLVAAGLVIVCKSARRRDEVKFED